MHCENAVFQFNEVYNGPSTNADGSPYDMDSGLKDVVYQFNYSHNNPCGWMLYMGKNNNDIIRYNISDDGGDYIIKYFLTACETPTYFLNNVIIYDERSLCIGTHLNHRHTFTIMYSIIKAPQLRQRGMILPDISEILER